MSTLLAILSLVLGPTVTLVVAFRLRKAQGEIKISVDGRLEHAYESIDWLQAEVAQLKGTQAPPPVAGQSNTVHP